MKIRSAFSSEIARQWFDHFRNEYAAANNLVKIRNAGHLARPIDYERNRRFFRNGVLSHSCQAFTKPSEPYERYFHGSEVNNGEPLKDQLVVLAKTFSVDVEHPLEVLGIGFGQGVAAVDFILTCQKMQIPARISGIDIRRRVSLREDFDSYCEREFQGFQLSISAIRDYIKQVHADIDFIEATFSELRDAGFIQFISVPAEDMPQEWTNRFHLAVSVQTLKYVFDKIRALEEVGRVLIDGGVAYLHLGTDEGDFDPLLSAPPTLQKFRWNIHEQTKHKSLLLIKDGLAPLITGLIKDGSFRYKGLPIPQGMGFEGLIPSESDYPLELLAKISDGLPC